jgi:hypothetical protein
VRCGIEDESGRHEWDRGVHSGTGARRSWQAGLYGKWDGEVEWAIGYSDDEYDAVARWHRPIIAVSSSVELVSLT